MMDMLKARDDVPWMKKSHQFIRKLFHLFGLVVTTSNLSIKACKSIQEVVIHIFVIIILQNILRSRYQYSYCTCS